MSILSWILFGALVGWIASALMGTRNSCCGNVILGIIGSFLGGLIFSLVGGVPVIGFDLHSVLVGVIGSVALIALFRAFGSSSERRTSDG